MTDQPPYRVPIPPEQTPPDFTVQVVSRFDLETSVETLKAAIGSQNFMVLHEINTQQVLSKAGLLIGGLRQIFFFQPGYMRQLLELNPTAILEAPLKLVVTEVSGGEVRVRYSRPGYLFGRYTGLMELGEDLEQVVEAVVATVRA